MRFALQRKYVVCLPHCLEGGLAMLTCRPERAGGACRGPPARAAKLLLLTGNNAASGRLREGGALPAWPGLCAAACAPARHTHGAVQCRDHDGCI